jgi:hypothetical protein
MNVSAPGARPQEQLNRALVGINICEIPKLAGTVETGID